jgi:hypothetical protein
MLAARVINGNQKATNSRLAAANGRFRPMSG